MDHSEELTTKKLFANIVNCMHPFVLKLPKLPKPYLTATFSGSCQKEIKFPIEYAKTFKLCASRVAKAKIIAAEQMTECDPRVKKVLKLKITFEEEEPITFVPGDSFAFLCQNSQNEVQMMLKRLGLETQGDMVYTIIPEEDSLVPSHICLKSTPKEYFSTYGDIRSIPKKVLLRVLAHYTEDDEERKVLELLSSIEGSDYYSKYILEPSLSVLDILMLFPTCKPPFERFLEHLPALKPRYYSVASSPLESDGYFELLVSIISLRKEKDHCVERKGVCSSWMERMAWCLSSNVGNEHIYNKLSVNIYKKVNRLFHLPEDIKKPLIFVGPGVGVAPFIGFLRHRELQCSHRGKLGETWLFYGCRYEDKDFLYRNELEKFSSNGTLTHFLVSYSRDNLSSKIRYVQDNIVFHACDLVNTIETGASIYVCGDAKNMMQDVRKAFSLALQKSKGCTAEVAKDILKKLDKENRYIVDVWL